MLCKVIPVLLLATLHVSNNDINKRDNYTKDEYINKTEYRDLQFQNPSSVARLNLDRPDNNTRAQLNFDQLGRNMTRQLYKNTANYDTTLSLGLLLSKLEMQLKGLEDTVHDLRNRSIKPNKVESIAKRVDQVHDSIVEIQQRNRTNLSVPGTLREKIPCNLCDVGWLFIAGPGRSGSTTLRDMLNIIPGVYIAGENRNLPSRLFDIYTRQYLSGSTCRGWAPTHTSAEIPISELSMSASERQKMLRLELECQLNSGQYYTNSSHIHNGAAWWHHSIDMANLKCKLQDLTKVLLGEYSTSSTKIVGFKEIRLDEHLLDFMHFLFPCSRFLVSTRQNIHEQAHSALRYGFHGLHTSKRADRNAKNENTLAKLFKSKKHILESWAQRQPRERAHLIRLEEFSPLNFTRVLRWMNISECYYRKIMQSNKNGGRNQHKWGSLSRNTSILQGQCILNDVGWHNKS